MSYADTIRSNSERPTCWGNARSYDYNDPECGGCKFKHSCKAKIDREEENEGSRVHVNYSSPNSQRTHTRRPSDMGEAGTHESGMVGPNEKPVERFFKDATGGALRGMFYEMWQFWRNFRIR